MLLRPPTLERHSTPPEWLAAIRAVPEDSRDTGLGVPPCPPQPRVAPAFSGRKWRGSLSSSCPARGPAWAPLLRRRSAAGLGDVSSLAVRLTGSPRAGQQDARPCFQVSPPVSLSSSHPVHPDPQSADSPVPSPYPTCHADQAWRLSRSTQHLAFSSHGRSWGGRWGGASLCFANEGGKLQPGSREPAEDVSVR